MLQSRLWPLQMDVDAQMEAELDRLGGLAEAQPAEEPSKTGRVFERDENATRMREKDDREKVLSEFSRLQHPISDEARGC